MGSKVPPHVAELIGRLRRDLGLSYRDICAHLHRKGIKPVRATEWSPMTVRNIHERGRRAARGQDITCPTRPFDERVI